jgi:integrase
VSPLCSSMARIVFPLFGPSVPAGRAGGNWYWAPRGRLHGPAPEIVSRRMVVRAEGKLFRDSRGDAWTKDAVCNRMHRLSRLTDRRRGMYDARHGFATRKLVQGHDHLTVAELMGHRDGTTLGKVYGHLDRNVGHLKKALEDRADLSNQWTRVAAGRA